VDRRKGVFLEKKFYEIADLFYKGDLLVLNNTKVIPARFFGKRKTGGRVEVFLHEKISDTEYKVLLRPSGRVKDKEEIIFAEGLRAVINKSKEKEITAEFRSLDGRTGHLMRSVGQVPLPPYITRNAAENDRERYQTVYAEKEGACAAPTAGLHFTPELIDKIRSAGVRTEYVTLHVGYGTFSPVKTDDITRHKMHREYFEMPPETAEMINETKKRGNNVIAAGTTSARVLESCFQDGKTEPKKGWTDLFIYPPYRFKVVDRLLTNFHLPKSTLLMLVCAFAGRELIFRAYDYAKEHGFRFYSYGDAMLIT
jgi:S-adenosylmethionine:tRNA ribosyltransferase-isomerase